MNTTSRCVYHVCTLPPKLSYVKKNSDQVRFSTVFSSVACILIGFLKGWEYEKKRKTHAKILDSVRKGLNSLSYSHASTEIHEKFSFVP